MLLWGSWGRQLSGYSCAQRVKSGQLHCLAVGPLGCPSPSLPVTQAPHNKRPFLSLISRSGASRRRMRRALSLCGVKALHRARSEMGRMGGR